MSPHQAAIAAKRTGDRLVLIAMWLIGLAFLFIGAAALTLVVMVTT